MTLQRHHSIPYRFLIAVWLLMTGGGACYAWTPSATQQAPDNAASAGTLSTYRGFSAVRTDAPVLSTDVCPSYRFRSTSPYSAIVGTTTDEYAPMAGPNRVMSWGNGTDPDDDPVGETPVGEPLVLLFFAIFWLIFLRISKKSSKFAG